MTPIIVKASSVIDKRISLEVRVMKERMQDIGGSLRWVSSERQLGDGFTKESARALLAARLRHGRIKLTWDPSYTAAKRKTKMEREKAIAESTDSFKPEHSTNNEEIPQNEDMPEYELPPDTKDTQEFFDTLEDNGDHKNVELCEYVHFAQNTEAPTYVFLASHVVSRANILPTGRMKYVHPKSMKVCGSGFWFWAPSMSRHSWVCSCWVATPRVNPNQYYKTPPPRRMKRWSLSV